MTGNNNHEAVKKLNEKLTRTVVLPALSKTLGEEFSVTIRRLTGKHIKLFEEMPPEMNRLSEADLEVTLRTFPWLKKLVVATIVSPKLSEKPIGEHPEDELSVDALEADLYIVVQQIMLLSGLITEEEAEPTAEPAVPFQDAGSGPDSAGLPSPEVRGSSV